MSAQSPSNPATAPHCTRLSRRQTPSAITPMTMPGQKKRAAGRVRLKSAKGRKNVQKSRAWRSARCSPVQATHPATDQSSRSKKTVSASTSRSNHSTIGVTV